MSGYSSMQAPPFWKWMLRISGVLCVVTLMTPTGYFVKYLLFDNPQEQRVQQFTPDSSVPILPTSVRNMDVFIHAARYSRDTAVRLDAIRDLGAVITRSGEQVTHPIECLYAKMALGDISESDPNPTVKNIAQTTLLNVAAHGAIIQR